MEATAGASFLVMLITIIIIVLAMIFAVAIAGLVIFYFIRKGKK